MNIHAYFIFPELEEYFLGIGDGTKEYENVLTALGVIRKQLSKFKKAEIWYDSENLKTYLAKAKILTDDVYLARFDIALRTFFGSGSQDIRTKPRSVPDCWYVLWYYGRSCEPAPTIASEIVEAKLGGNADDAYTLVNIDDAIFTEREHIYVVKDALHFNELPKIFPIQSTVDEIGFSEWLTLLEKPPFTLHDRSKFRITNMRWKKQRVYEEIESGNLWYFDYFHKDNKVHYEVFDSTGDKHLGEASINGELDATKAGKKKINKMVRGD